MDVELTARTRSGSGKGPAGRLRREDRVPAVLYGPKTEPISLSVSARRLERLLRDAGEESRLLRITVEDIPDFQPRQVLIREVQVHPVRRRFLHVDFYEVPLDQDIEVDVPVELIGEPIGVKKGGTINLISRMLTVRCLPGDIPEKVPVDVSGLDVADTIHVGELTGKVPFTLADEPGMAVVNIIPPEGASKEGEAAEEEG